MKVRKCFISNSSSSSYIVCRPKEVLLKDFCDKIVDHCLDKKYNWLDKEYKKYEIVKSDDYNKPNNIRYRCEEKQHLLDIFENYTVQFALPIYLGWRGWYKLFTKANSSDYYNYDDYSDKIMLGGKIPLDMIKQYYEKGKKFLDNFDEEYTKWVQEYQKTDEWFDIQYCDKKDVLQKDLEWLQSLINRINNENCEFYGMRVSSSGDCPTEDGIYSFEAICPGQMPDIREGVTVVERLQNW